MNNRSIPLNPDAALAWRCAWKEYFESRWDLNLQTLQYSPARVLRKAGSDVVLALEVQINGRRLSK